MSSDNLGPNRPSRWLAIIEATAISPDDAREFVDALYARRAKRFPNESRGSALPQVSEYIIRRYARLAAIAGAAAALPGVVPGVGTAVAFGLGAVDVTAAMKFQVDMCRCLAVNYGLDLTSEDAKHLSLIIAFCGAVEQTAGPAAAKIGAKIGVRLAQQYLHGAVLFTLKEMGRAIGVTLTRKVLKTIIPFGVGAAVNTGINYSLTRYVGYEAKKFLELM